MWNETQNGQTETVVVTVRGRVLDSASFRGKAEAEVYKGGVRRWAREKGIMVRVWSSHGPVAGAVLDTALPLFAPAC